MSTIYKFCFSIVTEDNKKIEDDVYIEDIENNMSWKDQYKHAENTIKELYPEIKTIELVYHCAHIPRK